MNRWSRGTATLVAGGLLLAACVGEPEGDTAGTESPVSVRVSRALTAPELGSYPATVEASETAELATRASGTIQRILVDVGSRVGEGDTLVVLDWADVRARISGARAQAQVARKAYHRIRSLASDGAASQQELDEVTARLESAEAALEEARAQVAYAVLRAPFVGVVTGRWADRGDLAAPGRRLLTLSGEGGVQVSADLPGRLAGSVAVGDRLPVGHQGGELTATVTRVVPVLGRDSRRFRVEAALPAASDLLPGAYARLRIASPRDETRWIPADAVVRSGQLTGVYTVESERLRLRWVRLGETRDEAVELLSGWVEGRPVVRSPGAGFRDGTPVAEMEEVGWSMESGVATEGS